jgi:uncharacterized protein (DUF1800 family)
VNELEKSTFARRVAFGIAPDESVPKDAVGWAEAQLDSAPVVALHADRAGAMVTGLPPTLLLVDTPEDVAAAVGKFGDDLKEVARASRRLQRPELEALYIEKIAPHIYFTQWKETFARGCMAVNGPAPVFERFWHFWTSHFTVAPSVNNNSAPAVGPFMRMLRTHMGGNFRDMLFAAVTHPGMTLYLDNDRSTGPNSPWRRSNRTKDEINENLGRELLELFTITTASGYSQADVLAVTYILTGWSVELSGFNKGIYFNNGRHEPSAQTFMGKTYKALMRQDSKLHELVDDLAAHPLTAQHICRKIATAFVSENPAPDCVARLVSVFTSSKGSLPALHKAVVREVATAGKNYQRFSDPQTWLWTAYRISGAKLPAEPPKAGMSAERLPTTLTELGQPIHNCPQPNGWSLQSRDWISREMLDRRVRYAYNLGSRIPNAAQLLPALLARQHDAKGPLVQQLTAAIAKGNSMDDLWTMYFNSPEFLWSNA